MQAQRRRHWPSSFGPQSSRGPSNNATDGPEAGVASRSSDARSAASRRRAISPSESRGPVSGVEIAAEEHRGVDVHRGHASGTHFHCHGPDVQEGEEHFGMAVGNGL